MANMDAPPSSPEYAARRRKEIFVFLLLALGIWPIIAIGIVGAYGFAVWFYQILTGPPGPPPGAGH